MKSSLKKLKLSSIMGFLLVGAYFVQNDEPTTKVAETEENQHVIPSDAVKAVDSFYDAKSSDQLLIAQRGTKKLEELNKSQLKSLTPVIMIQLNKTKSNEWVALFETEEEQLIKVPLAGFSGTVVNGNEIEVITGEAESYYLLSRA